MDLLELVKKDTDDIWYMYKYTCYRKAKLIVFSNANDIKIMDIYKDVDKGCFQGAKYAIAIAENSNFHDNPDWVFPKTFCGYYVLNNNGEWQKSDKNWLEINETRMEFGIAYWARDASLIKNVEINRNGKRCWINISRDWEKLEDCLNLAIPLLLYGTGKEIELTNINIKLEDRIAELKDKHNSELNRVSVERLQSEVKQFAIDKGLDKLHNRKDLALALSIKAAKLQESFLWKKPEDADKEKIMDSLADVLNYALLIAEEYNLNICHIAREKLRISKKL